MNLKALCDKLNYLQNLPIEELNGSPQVLIGFRHAHLVAPVDGTLYHGNGPTQFKLSWHACFTDLCMIMLNLNVIKIFNKI